MPALAPTVTDERDALATFLNQQREALIAGAFGLTEEQARSAPSVSELSIAGLIQHGLATERGWILDTMLRREVPFREDDPQFFRVTDDVTVADLIAQYREVAAETDAIIAGLDLDLPVPAPEAPWFPAGVVWNARWVLFHLIEETARHAGHADIVRESIDGANAFVLIAEAEAALVG